MDPPKKLDSNPPILFVHGMNDTHHKWMPILERVLAEGATSITAMDYKPADGSVSIVALADQVDAEVSALMEATGAEKIDVVAFSLGTQVVRYWLHRGGGKQKVRRFVAMSGPFHGTTWAHFGLGLNTVMHELTPGSDFLKQFEDEDYRPVDVVTISTPFDGVIVPASSAVIDSARTNISVDVVSHPMMYLDERAHDALVEVLAAPEPK